MLCTFWLRNVFRATTACTFSTFQLPKVFQDPGVLYILTWKCASRHNGVHFSSLIWPAGSAPAALASLLFDPPGPQIIGKTQCFATFLPFRASASSFFWLFLFSDLLSSNLSLLSASALLCFSSVHTVGSLTSKFPSATLPFCSPHTVWGLLPGWLKKIRQRYGFFLCLSGLLCALYCTQAGYWLPGLRYHQLVFAAPVMPGATSRTWTFWRNAKPESRMCHATSLQCNNRTWMHSDTCLLVR